MDTPELGKLLKSHIYFKFHFPLICYQAANVTLWHRRPDSKILGRSRLYMVFGCAFYERRVRAVNLTAIRGTT